MPVWSSSSRPPRARRQRSDKAGPAQAGPATFGEFSLSLNSIADPPASVGIANTVRPAAAAGSGYHHYSARRDHDSRSDVGSAHAIGIAMPSRSASTSDRGDQPRLALLEQSERHRRSGRTPEPEHRDLECTSVIDFYYEERISSA